MLWFPIKKRFGSEYRNETVRPREAAMLPAGIVDYGAVITAAAPGTFKVRRTADNTPPVWAGIERHGIQCRAGTERGLP